MDKVFDNNEWQTLKELVVIGLRHAVHADNTASARSLVSRTVPIAVRFPGMLSLSCIRPMLSAAASDVCHTLQGADQGCTGSPPPPPSRAPRLRPGTVPDAKCQLQWHL